MENNKTMFKSRIEEVEPISTPQQKASGGIPLSANFNLNAQVPLDDRQFAFTIADRDAIPPIRRWEGMTVFVAEGEGITYQLKGGIENSNWVKFGTSHAGDVDGLHTVATSGRYEDLEGVPTRISEFENDANYITVDDIYNEVAYGADQPEDERNNLWFEVTNVETIMTEEEGVFLKSSSEKKFKLCVSSSGRLYTEQVEGDIQLFQENIIVMSDNNVRFKVCVDDEGRVFAEEAI